MVYYDASLYLAQTETHMCYMYIVKWFMIIVQICINIVACFYILMSVEYAIMLQQYSAHFHLNQLTLHVLGRTNYPYTSLEI